MAIRGRAPIATRFVAIGICIGLSACVSSVTPVAMVNDPAIGESQTGNQITIAQYETPDAQITGAKADPRDSGKQLLAKTEAGNIVAVPLRNPSRNVGIAHNAISNPQQIANADAAQNSLTTANTIDQNGSAILAIAPTRNPAALQNKDANQIATNANQTTIENGADPAAPQLTAESVLAPKPAEVKKQGFLARLFQRSKNKSAANNKPVDDRRNAILMSSRTASQANRVTVQPSTASLGGLSGTKLPGVKNNKTGEVQIASAVGLSRTPINGLKIQHSGVNVTCIMPGVLRIVRIVEKHYGKKPVVTSGYRSPSRNRKAGGARNSMHIYCKAVDIQVDGISKWDLAKFLRTVPGRGGVGTYCRTRSVHVDTGPKRDWHYSCRRKSKRTRKT